MWMWPLLSSHSPHREGISGCLLDSCRLFSHDHHQYHHHKKGKTRKQKGPSLLMSFLLHLLAHLSHHVIVVVSLTVFSMLVSTFCSCCCFFFQRLKCLFPCSVSRSHTWVSSNHETRERNSKTQWNSYRKDTVCDENLLLPFLFSWKSSWNLCSYSSCFPFV